MKRVVVVVALACSSSCALFSGRLPCSKDADCLNGDVCASDGQCAPGRTSSEGEGEGASVGEGEGEGSSGARVRTVTTTIGSIVDIGVELDDAFRLHVLPFGATMCSADDCTTATGCDVPWSSTVGLVLSDAGPSPAQGVEHLGSATVGVIVETSASFAGGDVTLLGRASGTVTLLAGHGFVQVTYADNGTPVDCTTGTDNRCHGSFVVACD